MVSKQYEMIKNKRATFNCGQKVIMNSASYDVMKLYLQAINNFRKPRYNTNHVMQGSGMINA
jgi:hypothetical protein